MEIEINQIRVWGEKSSLTLHNPNQYFTIIKFETYDRVLIRYLKDGTQSLYTAAYVKLFSECT